MNRPAKQIDQVHVTRATDHAISCQKDVITRALEAATDPHKTERLTACQCIRCYYIYPDRIGGAAMTVQPCGVCGKDVMYGSTATDVLCLPCAKEHELCKHCGGDVHMRPRRKFPK